MRRKFAAGWLLSLFSSLSLAQVPAADLYTPPAGARHFIIESTGGKHGDSWSWVTADGARFGRESLNLRGQVSEIDYKGVQGTGGMPSAITIRGVTPQGDAAESYSTAGGIARWRSPVDARSTAFSGHGLDLPRSTSALRTASAASCSSLQRVINEANGMILSVLIASLCGQVIFYSAGF